MAVLTWSWNSAIALLLLLLLLLKSVTCWLSNSVCLSSCFLQISPLIITQRFVYIFFLHCIRLLFKFFRHLVFLKMNIVRQKSLRNGRFYRNQICMNYNNCTRLEASFLVARSQPYVPPYCALPGSSQPTFTCLRRLASCSCISIQTVPYQLWRYSVWIEQLL